MATSSHEAYSAGHTSLTSNGPPHLIGTPRMIFHVAMAADDGCSECAHICLLRVCVCDSTWAAACSSCTSGWGDPEDCSECVSVSLINSNTGAFGACGQVNETQWEDTFPWFASPPGSRGWRDEVQQLAASFPRAGLFSTNGTVWYTP